MTITPEKRIRRRTRSLELQLSRDSDSNSDIMSIQSESRPRAVSMFSQSSHSHSRIPNRLRPSTGLDLQAVDETIDEAIAMDLGMESEDYIYRFRQTMSPPLSPLHLGGAKKNLLADKVNNKTS